MYISVLMINSTELWVEYVLADRLTYDATAAIITIITVAAVRLLLGIYILSKDGGRTY